VNRTSLVICTLSWNDAHATAPMLRALRAERAAARWLGIDVAIVAYDNGSTDGTPALLSSGERTGVIDHLILCDENLGNSVARNHMINWSLGRKPDAIAFVDGDIVPTIGALSAFTRELIRSSTTIGSIGADYFSRAQTTSTIRATAFKLKVRRSHCRVINSIALTQFGVFRAKMFHEGLRFETTPPFDGPGWGSEDNDLGYQMLDRGYVTLMHTGFVYRHLRAGGSIREMLKADVDPQERYEARRQFVVDKWKDHPAVSRVAINDVSLASFPIHKLAEPAR
jgi:glycosyltransferase involved in cell wall biosynthesis